MNVRPVELDPLLHQARQLLGNALGPLITVDLRLGAGGVWVRTDPDQLELAILNLAVNARDAMPEGGALIVASGPSGLEPTSHDDGAQFISICVTDTGEGMSEAVLDQAVEPFFTTKARGKGTGLGLAQVYGFVRQSGGDMHIRSQLGVGTTVELLLKRDIQGEAYPRGTAVSGPAPKAVAGEGRLVLVVDDDDVVRGVLVESLRTAGFRVVEASSGEEGLRRLDAERPVAAIIDFIMPGMNGVDVARRAQACFPDMPIIFVSGYFDTVALDGVMGAVVLRKPFDVEGLNRAVSSALQ